MNYNWEISQINDKTVSSVAEEFQLPNAIAKIMVQRGIISRKKSRQFFYPDASQLHDPYLMQGMKQAVARINKLIENNGTLLLFGDYDVDGTTGTAAMYLFFKKLGVDVHFYIPDREREGYGVSLNGIDFAVGIGAELLITCDCGITAVDQTEYANSNGIDVIITDHHKQDEELPNAEAILNPNQNNCAYPFKGLCGAGVWTVSAGNMAQGLAWCARERGIDCTVIVPEQIPETKAANITRLGAKYIKVPFAKFEETFITRSFPGVDGHFIHPFSDLSVMAGNGTIGLEILEDLPDVQSLIISYAGGGLSCGIASAVKAINPSIKIYAAEVETGAPFAASLELGQPKVVNYTSSFVDGIGGSMVFNEMFDLAKELLDGSFISSLEEIAVASKIIMERNRIIVEGAAGAAVAAAMAGKAGKSKTACIISGGNIDSEKIKLILSGKIP